MEVAEHSSQIMKFFIIPTLSLVLHPFYLFVDKVAHVVIILYAILPCCASVLPKSL
jgi:hypothetical protein